MIGPIRKGNLTKRKAYYFDMLPIHPKPERLESLTSYMLRIAEANAIQNISASALLNLLFGDSNITDQWKDLIDFPLVSFGNILKVTHCSASEILATTFFHLGLFRK